LDAISSIIGQSTATLSLKQLIQRVAPSDATALIIGESGTGKELVARALHDCSPRAQSGQFVPVNCGAIPRELIESELFGHKKGSFTGAISDRKGRFELAHGGTLFLDEIGDLALDMQVKLLRAIQERTIDPIGGGKSIAVDVRVVAATHRDLEQEVAAGRFREDLYYRLNVLPVSTPALRDRTEDLHALISHFAHLHATQGYAPIQAQPSLMEALCGYAWPGNIRELSNLVARFSALFAGQALCYHDIPQDMLPRGLRGLNPEPTPAQPHAGSLAPVECARAVPIQLPLDVLPDEPNPIEDLIAFTQEGSSSLFALDGIPLKKKLVDFERGLIERALDQAKGNISQTARILNVQRTTLIEKINKYGLNQLGSETSMK
jgi:sigma-54 specific flagellar transcriptional regulator A